MLGIKFVQSAFNNELDTKKILKRGETSIVCEDKANKNKVIVYTSDAIKLKWFQQDANHEFKFKLLGDGFVGSSYDEVRRKIYKFSLVKMYNLEAHDKVFINNKLIKPFNQLKGFEPKMKFMILSERLDNEYYKQLCKHLSQFCAKNRVVVDFKASSFMKMDCGRIVCVDPLYASR